MSECSARLYIYIFRYVCGDSSLLLSTVVSLPCEVSTEALISDLQLTRVSVDRLTAETVNLAVGCLLIGSVSQGNSNLAQRTHPKIVIPSSHPSPGLPDLEQAHAASLRARQLLCRPSKSAGFGQSLVWASPASYSAPMLERLPTA